MLPGLCISDAARGRTGGCGARDWCRMSHWSLPRYAPGARTTPQQVARKIEGRAVTGPANSPETSANAEQLPFFQRGLSRKFRRMLKSPHPGFVFRLHHHSRRAQGYFLFPVFGSHRFAVMGAIRRLSMYANRQQHHTSPFQIAQSRPMALG